MALPRAFEATGLQIEYSLRTAVATIETNCYKHLRQDLRSRLISGLIMWQAWCALRARSPTVGSAATSVSAAVIQKMIR